MKPQIKGRLLKLDKLAWQELAAKRKGKKDENRETLKKQFEGTQHTKTQQEQTTPEGMWEPPSTAKPCSAFCLGRQGGTRYIWEDCHFK